MTKNSGGDPAKSIEMNEKNLGEVGPAIEAAREHKTKHQKDKGVRADLEKNCATKGEIHEQGARAEEAVGGAAAPVAGGAAASSGSTFGGDDRHAKIVEEGEAAHKVFDVSPNFCHGRSQDLGHKTETGASQTASLKATIAECDATISAKTSKVGELAASITSDGKNLAGPEQRSLRAVRRSFYNLN